MGDKENRHSSNRPNWGIPVERETITEVSHPWGGELAPIVTVLDGLNKRHGDQLWSAHWSLKQTITPRVKQEKSTKLFCSDSDYMT